MNCNFVIVLCLDVLLAVAATSCHIDSSQHSQTSASGSCSPPADIGAKLSFTGFLPGKNGATPPAGYISKGSWLTALTPNCTVQWLQIATGGVNISILHPDSVFPPNQMDVMAAAPAACPVPDPLPVLSVDGWEVKSGSLTVTESVAPDWTPIGSGWDVTVTCNDLVLKNSATGEQKTGGFRVETRVARRCAKQGASAELWKVETAGITSLGQPTCMSSAGTSAGNEWNGKLAPLNPPFFCIDTTAGEVKD